jgi:hypothetical protein
MATLVLAALLMHHSDGAQNPAITLRLLAPKNLATRAGHGGTDGRLDGFETKATASGTRPPIEMSVVVKAHRAGDVWVDRNALSLEIRGLDGRPLRSRCRIEHAIDLEPQRRDEVRLRAGQTMRVTLTVGHSAAGVRGAVCFGTDPNAARRLGVVAVYNPADAHPYPMRPRDGATPLVKHLESNLIAIPSLDAP